jgi:hypothetical protein
MFEINFKDFEHYKQIDGQGFATLVKNKNHNRQPFRMVIVFEKKKKDCLISNPLNLKLIY